MVGRSRVSFCSLEQEYMADYTNEKRFSFFEGEEVGIFMIPP